MKSVETQARCWQVCLSLSFPSDDLNILLAPFGMWLLKVMILPWHFNTSRPGHRSNAQLFFILLTVNYKVPGDPFLENPFLDHRLGNRSRTTA